MSRPLRLLTLATLAGAFLRVFQLTAVPAGLHYDLAATALLGNDIAFGGYRPVFIEAYTGHEVGFYYWLAAWFRLIGSSVFGLRLAAAMLGVLAIPCAYFAIRQVAFADRRPRAVAALGAILLSFAFFHVTFSRFGFRVISEPIAQSLAIGFLWRGLRRTASGRRAALDIVLAGVFTGLTAYTYLAARLFPFPIAVALLALFAFPIFDKRLEARRPAAQWLGPYLLFGLTAALVFAPLGYFFYTHPDALFVRASQLAPRPEDASLLRLAIRRAAEMVFINGEPYDRFNIPGRPLFGPILGASFVLGLTVTLKRVWQQKAPLSRATEVLLLAWLPIMLVPTALAIHDVFPSNVRAFGEIPLLFVFPARGLLAAVDWAAGRVRWLRAGPARVFAWTAGAALLFGTLATGHAYFQVWAKLPNQYMNNDSDLVSAARWLNSQDNSDATVYVTSFHYRHPTLAYLARDYSRLHSIYQAGVLPVPEAGGALYVFPRSSPPPAAWLNGWDPYLVASPLGPDGTPDFRAFRFSSGAEVPPPALEPAQGNLGNIAELTGFALVSATIGEAATVDLGWRVLNVPETGDFRVVADWVDAWGGRWSQGFNDAYPSEQWLSGETLVTRLTMPLPAGLPPGAYTLATTLYSPSTRQALTAIGPNGEFAGVAARVGPIVLGPDTPRASALALKPQIVLGSSMGGLTLVGFDPAQPSARPGERLNLALYWEAAARPGVDYRPRLSLTKGSGSLTLSETHPVKGSYPTSQWPAGQSLVDRYSLRLPRGLEPGPYRLTLDLMGPNGNPWGSADLGPVQIQPLERSFALPATAHPAQAAFGDVIQFAGIDLAPESPTAHQPFTVTVHWRALAETETDYTAFIHVLDSDRALVAQHDAPPRDGGYPTSMWAQGEYISDTHTFALPPGDYSVEVGMYLPENGLTLGRARAHEFRVSDP